MSLSRKGLECGARRREGETGLTITLTKAQTKRIAREFAGGNGGLAPLVHLGALEWFATAVSSSLENRRLSHSTLRALLVLLALPADGTPRSLKQVANAVGLTPSTTHRYLATWLAVGLLEQSPTSRRYRRTLPSGR